jgi:chlorobactene glucosyltransferase
MSHFWIQHQAGLIFFVGVLLLIALSNLRTWRRLGEYPPPLVLPPISVLVPARNEERNIGPCVRSLLAQDYPDLELLVLDDDSSDNTGLVLAGLATDDDRLSVLKGRPLPPQWLGKHWACHQLAQAARGELLLFVDADTRHQVNCLRDAVAALLAEKADLLAVLPRQQVISWPERLIVPLMPWSIFSFLPLCLAYRVRTPALSATVGQFMLFGRQAYDSIGGHAAVRFDVVDDLALGRRIKANGMRWRLVDGRDHVGCRMYHSFREAVEGFSKSLFAVFGYNVPFFSFVWLWLWIVFTEPLLVLLLGLVGVRVPPANLLLASTAVVLSLVLWGISHWRFGFPLYLTLLYPLSIFTSVIIAMRSMLLTKLGRTTWKGRRLVRRNRRRSG